MFSLSIFFLSGFSFTDSDDLQYSKVREGTIFYSTLPLPPAHEHSDIYLQLCMWDDYHVLLIATLVFTRLLLDEIYHLIELPIDWLSDWLIDWLIDWWSNVCFFTWWLLDPRFLLQQLDMGKRWIWARVDYHPCITSEPTNQWTASVDLWIFLTSLATVRRCSPMWVLLKIMRNLHETTYAGVNF